MTRTLIPLLATVLSLPACTANVESDVGRDEGVAGKGDDHGTDAAPQVSLALTHDALILTAGDREVEISVDPVDAHHLEIHLDVSGLFNDVDVVLPMEAVNENGDALLAAVTVVRRKSTELPDYYEQWVPTEDEVTEQRSAAPMRPHFEAIAEDDARAQLMEMFERFDTAFQQGTLDMGAQSSSADGVCNPAFGPCH